MRNADTPSGPGKPVKERSAATAEQEGLDELALERGEATPADPATSARHADRNAHANSGTDGAGDSGSGGS